MSYRFISLLILLLIQQHICWTSTMYNKKKTGLNLNINHEPSLIEMCGVKKWEWRKCWGLSVGWCKDTEQREFKAFIRSRDWMIALRLWISVSWWTGSTLIWIPGDRRQSMWKRSGWDSARADARLHPDLGAACFAEDVPEPQRLVSCSCYDGLAIWRRRLYTTRHTLTSHVCLHIIHLHIEDLITLSSPVIWTWF